MCKKLDKLMSKLEDFYYLFSISILYRVLVDSNCVRVEEIPPLLRINLVVRFCGGWQPFGKVHSRLNADSIYT